MYEIKIVFTNESENKMMRDPKTGYSLCDVCCTESTVTQSDYVLDGDTINPAFVCIWCEALRRVISGKWTCPEWYGPKAKVS